MPKSHRQAQPQKSQGGPLSNLVKPVPRHAATTIPVSSPFRSIHSIAPQRVGMEAESPSESPSSLAISGGSASICVLAGHGGSDEQRVFGPWFVWSEACLISLFDTPLVFARRLDTKFIHDRAYVPGRRDRSWLRATSAVSARNLLSDGPSRQIISFARPPLL